MYVTRLRLDGVRGFHGQRACDLDFTRPDGRYAGWTVIAGRNGSGKTTLLRAIAVGLAGPKRASQLDSDLEGELSFGRAEGSLTVDIQASPEADIRTQPHGESLTARVDWKPEREAYSSDDEPPTELQFSSIGDLKTRLWSSAPPPGWFHAGYGPFRRITGTGLYERTPPQLDRTAALKTLFEEWSALTEPFDWLLSAHLRRLEDRNRPPEDRTGAQELVDSVLALLNDGLLRDGYRIVDVDSDGMWLHRQSQVDIDDGQRIEVRRTSDGQRTVIALVLDIVRQMDAAYENLAISWRNHRPYLSYPGVVLIDEVDTHLHMTWQKEIGKWFKDHFPAVQFIVSTHSPYICQAADEGGLIRLPGPDEQEPPAAISPALWKRIVYGTGDDAALSELFGLDTPYSDEAQLLRRELTGLEARVVMGEATEEEEARHDELRQRLKSSPRTRVAEVQARLRRLGVFDE
ncbi:AAA family ATPase [Streptomyces sp. G9]|uniref:AAA family ATPase n=1 Tax=Streptomyces sp. G9 TaxID=1684483 RepID=UPI003D728F7C